MKTPEKIFVILIARLKLKYIAAKKICMFRLVVIKINLYT